MVNYNSKFLNSNSNSANSKNNANNNPINFAKESIRGQKLSLHALNELNYLINLLETKDVKVIISLTHSQATIGYSTFF